MDPLRDEGEGDETPRSAPRNTDSVTFAVPVVDGAFAGLQQERVGGDRDREDEDEAEPGAGQQVGRHRLSTDRRLERGLGVPLGLLDGGHLLRRLHDSLRQEGARARRDRVKAALAVVNLSDRNGKSRLRLMVDSLGTPSLEFLDETGKVTSRLPEK